MARMPSQPGDPPGSWRDALGGLRAANGTTLTNPDGSDPATTGNGNLAGAGNYVHNLLFGGSATKGMLTGPQTGQYQRDYLQGDFMNRQAPQMDQGQSDQTRAQQGQLAQMLFRTASGQQQGAGELAAQRGVNNAMAQQTSAAQMARGANAALAARNAARSTADIGVNGAGQMGIARMQDQQGAVSQLGGLLGQQRGQDIGVAQGNQQAQMGQQQLQLSALAQMLGVDQAALQQDLAKRGLKMQDKGILPSLLQSGGQALAAGAA